MNDITKVKYDGEKVEIHYGTSYSRCQLKLVSADQPTAEFLRALQAFDAAVIEILELPSEYEIGLTIRGVSISYDENGDPKCTITALKALSNSDVPAVLNTPHGCEFSNDAALLEDLTKQACLYIDGQRQQGMFNFSEEPEREVSLESGGKKASVKATLKVLNRVVGAN